MAGLVQTSGKKAGVGLGLTVTYNMPANFTVGNWVVLTAFLSQDIASILIAGSAPATDNYNFGFGGYVDLIGSVQIVNSGRSDIVVTWNSGAANEVTLSAQEWDNFLSGPVDQAPAAVNDTVITSGTTSQANEVVYAHAARAGHGDGSQTWTCASGYTTAHMESGAANPNSIAAYKVVAATGAQSATIDSTSSITMVTYKTSGGGGGGGYMVDDDQVVMG